MLNKKKKEEEKQEIFKNPEKELKMIEGMQTWSKTNKQKQTNRKFS